ncbi:MAG: hypothetical protein OEM58_00835 [Nitrospirota bacterium]|jgi:hypothetical protein|nr:hypothetical protein [Nitrospirota bacterium]
MATPALTLPDNSETEQDERKPMTAVGRLSKFHQQKGTRWAAFEVELQKNISPFVLTSSEIRKTYLPLFEIYKKESSATSYSTEFSVQIHLIFLWIFRQEHG